MRLTLTGSVTGDTTSITDNTIKVY